MKLRRLAALLLALMVLTGCLPAALADSAAPDGTETVTFTFLQPSKTNPEVTWSYPYKDSWFTQDQNTYHHDMAQGTFGLAMAGFRITDNRLGFQQGNLMLYFNQTGFSHAEYYGYDETPGEFTISNGIAMKKIGDVTVVAVSVCGQGYGNEWISNFTVGTGVRSEGFENAALQVEERIRSYLTEYGISGEVCLWVTGYSRAAATANIVAADMTDSGLFTRVYGYTFATPNTTREPGNYTNIFNVIGKYDPVPTLPLKDWGFSRYGVTLQTPAQETDYDYADAVARADAASQKILGRRFVTSPTINEYLHTVFSYLYDIVPTQDLYVKDLQEVVKSVWRKKGSAGDMLDMVTTVFRQVQTQDADRQTLVGDLVDYLVNIAAMFTSGTQEEVLGDQWDSEEGLTGNLARQHMPSTYLCWLFSSDDPQDVFTDNTSSVRITVTGNVDVNIYDSYGYVQTVTAEGDEIIEVPADHQADTEQSTNPNTLHVERANNRTMVICPMEESYIIEVVPREGVTSFKYFHVSYSGESLLGTSGKQYTVEVTEDQKDYYILSLEKGTEIDGEDYSGVIGQAEEDDGSVVENATRYSPTSVLKLEDMNIFHLSMKQIYRVGILSIILLLVVFGLFLFQLFRRWALHKEASRAAVIGEHVSFAMLFLILEEICSYFMTAIPALRVIFGVLFNLTIALLAFRATRTADKRFGTILLTALLISVVGDILTLTNKTLPSLTAYILTCVVLAVGFATLKKPRLKELFVWLIVTAVLGAAMYIFLFKEFSQNFVLALVFAAALTAMNVTADRLSRVMRITVMIFMVPDLLRAWECIWGYDATVHTISMLVYFALVLLLAIVLNLRSFRLARTARKYMEAQKAAANDPAEQEKRKQEEEQERKRKEQEEAQDEARFME